MRHRDRVRTAQRDEHPLIVRRDRDDVRRLAHERDLGEHLVRSRVHHDGIARHPVDEPVLAPVGRHGRAMRVVAARFGTMARPVRTRVHRMPHTYIAVAAHQIHVLSVGCENRPAVRVDLAWREHLHQAKRLQVHHDSAAFGQARPKRHVSVTAVRGKGETHGTARFLQRRHVAIEQRIIREHQLAAHCEAFVVRVDDNLYELPIPRSVRRTDNRDEHGAPVG